MWERGDRERGGEVIYGERGKGWEWGDVGRWKRKKSRSGRSSQILWFFTSKCVYRSWRVLLHLWKGCRKAAVAAEGVLWNLIICLKLCRPSQHQLWLKITCLKLKRYRCVELKAMMLSNRCSWGQWLEATLSATSIKYSKSQHKTSEVKLHCRIFSHEGRMCMLQIQHLVI